MSKRRRRRKNSLRRKSTRCTKQSQSQYTSQHQSQSSSSTVCKDDHLEKDCCDSLRKESFHADSDEGEAKGYEAHRRETRFRVNHWERAFQGNRKSPSSAAEEADKGVRITTSVRIDDYEVITSRLAFQNSRESADTDEAHGWVSVTTTKVTRSGSKVEVEISEVMHSDNSDMENTLVVRDGNWRRKGAGLTNRWENCAPPNNENLNQPYSASHDFNGPVTNRQHKQCKLSICEMNADLTEVANSQVQSRCREEKVCCQSCCEEGIYNHNHNHNQPLTNMGSNEAISDIPPPQECADNSFSSLDDLTENVASCEISSGNNFDHRGRGMASTALARPSDSGDKPESVCRDSRESESLGDGMGYLEGLPGLDAYSLLLQGYGMPMSRYSYTKEFIHNHKGTEKMRNNSIAILETKPRIARYFVRSAKRRQTFPGPTDSSSKMEEGTPSYRESFSSDTLSPFFAQCLPLQAARLGRFYNERPSLFSTESSKSSEGSTGYKVSSSKYNDYRTVRSNSSNYGTARNSCSTAGETQEEEFGARRHSQHRQAFNEEWAPVPMAAMSPRGDLCTDAANHDNELENSEVAESGFDEEMPETEELVVDDLILKQRDLRIQVMPPSQSSSEKCIAEDSCQSIMQKEGVTNPKSKWPITIASTDFAPNKRKGKSVITCIIGGCEQRSIQNDKKPLEMTEEPERNQRVLPSAVFGAPSMSPALDIKEKEEAGNSEAFNDAKSTPRPTLIAESNDSIQTLVNHREMMEASGSPRECQAGMDNGPLSQPGVFRATEDKDIAKMEDVVTATTDTSGSLHRFQDSGVTDNKLKLQHRDLTKRLSISRSPTDIKAEVKEHLRPPGDLILKDHEDVLDHWAKRRKLFKESKQWSSTGGSSLTSNITEESGNSDDVRSVDISVRDIEDRGFYTETFHSASWVYRGDDIHPANSPRCLSNRPRLVTIRERTVRISRGPGDYPWGFRIQFSQPIVVTEVDTNGAAEEAGLLVGDSVLAVNGTDVTSVSHSEAAELAKQGPGILTLTIGSDISRHPSTPWPACRGYLHKRTQSGLFKGWRKRWFVLKHDCCLYYYRRKRDEGKTCALSAVKLEGAEVGPDPSLGKPFVFKCNPVSGPRVYYFCATSNQEMKRWLEAMDRAVQPTPQSHVWIDVIRHNSFLPPLAIKNPECLGLLHQLDKNKEFWVQHYGILKDGCLYFYAGIRSTHSMGGIFLHGYTVREQTGGSRCCTIELKPPSEEFKSFYLCAENVTETKRWSLAIKASINKWVLLHQVIEDLMNRPAEETRM